MVGRTAAFRKQRFRSRLGFAVALGTALTITVLVGVGRTTVLLATVAAFLGVLFGFIGWFVYGNYYDAHIRRHSRRIILEMCHSASEIPYEVDLTSEGVRVESQDTIVSIAWNRVKAVVDGAAAVELWFDPGLVRVPNRAFSNAEERHTFIGFSRKMAPNAGTA